MQAGLLSGSFSAARAAALPASDWRSRNADFKGEALQRNLAVAEAMRAVARRYDTSAAAIAVAWTLAWPGVTGASVGARSAQQVDRWIEAASLSLRPAEIADAIDRSGAGSGPSAP